MMVALLAAMASSIVVDHVTVAGASLEKMQAALAGTGIAAERGGPHNNHATEMAVVSFPDGSYLELIAIQPDADPQAVEHHPWAKFLRATAAPCGWAAQ